MTNDTSFYSQSLNREMKFQKYGYAGKPILVFPSSGGSSYEFADFGMIDACQSFIDRGLLQFYTADSYDNDSWLNLGLSGHEKVEAHARYEAYILHELIPYIAYDSQWYGKIAATGCSMGAFHVINFALRHPDVFDLSIAMSGVYDARFFTGEFGDDLAVYYQSPLDYLPHTHDAWYLDQYRQNHYVVAVGQGAWEGPHIADTNKLEHVFQEKGIPGWFDYWGPDVAHDWPWWQKQLPYFLTALANQGII